MYGTTLESAQRIAASLKTGQTLPLCQWQALCGDSR